MTWIARIVHGGLDNLAWPRGDRPGPKPDEGLQIRREGLLWARAAQGCSNWVDCPLCTKNALVYFIYFRFDEDAAGSSEGCSYVLQVLKRPDGAPSAAATLYRGSGGVNPKTQGLLAADRMSLVDL